MWVIFLLSAMIFAIVTLLVLYIGNKVINAMKRDDYKLNRDINKYNKEENEKEKEKHYRENNNIEKENNILKRYSDNELLLYSLSLLNITKEKLVEMYEKNERDISLEEYSDDKVVKWIKYHNEYFKIVKE